MTTTIPLSTQPYGYVRVSSDQQVEFGYSIDAQENFIKNYCKLYGFPEPIFIYDKGLSARTTKKREGIQEILKKIETGEIKFLITYNFSRMFRDIIGNLQFIDLIDRKGCAFVSMCEKYDTSTAMGMMQITMIAAFNRMMSDKISEDTSAVLQYKKSKYQTYCKAITGFDNVEGKMIVNEEEMKTVRLIFSLNTQGHGAHKIATQLNSMGITTKTGKVFKQNSVQCILDNRATYEPHLIP